jgi:hypothetical protein
MDNSGITSAGFTSSLAGVGGGVGLGEEDVAVRGYERLSNCMGESYFSGLRFWDEGVTPLRLEYTKDMTMFFFNIKKIFIYFK